MSAPRALAHHFHNIKHSKHLQLLIYSLFPISVWAPRGWDSFLFHCLEPQLRAYKGWQINWVEKNKS